MKLSRMTDAFRAHLGRLAVEDAAEHFADVDWYSVEAMHARGLQLEVGEPGWSRVWVAMSGDEVVGHAAVYDAFGPGSCGGHVSVERELRGLGMGADLNAERFQFLDEHQLVLVGRCAAGNPAHGWHLRQGLQVDHVHESGDTWFYREPKWH